MKPYGHNEDMLIWAKERGLKYAPSAHCLCWLNKKRCDGAKCVFNRGYNGWMDHMSGWTKGTERMLLLQPYQITKADLDTLKEACSRCALDLSISGRGWYGGGTVCIELRPIT